MFPWLPRKNHAGRAVGGKLLQPQDEIAHSLVAREISGTGRYFWLPQADTIEWSPGLAHIYGRTELAVLGFGLLHGVHPDDHADAERRAKAAIEGDAEHFSNSFRIVTPQGEVRRLVDRVRVERDQHGRAIRVEGLTIDVSDLAPLGDPASGGPDEPAGEGADTEPAKSARTLAESERLEVGQLTSGLALADIDYRAGMVRLGEYAARMFGFGTQATNVEREAILARFHPEDRERVMTEVRRALDPASEAEVTSEFRIVLPDGATRWLRVRVRIEFAMIEGRRQADRGVLAALDISAFKQAELQLRESEERSTLAQSVAGIGVWDVDLEHGITVWSDPLYELMQVDRDADVSPDLFFDRVHPEDVDRLRRDFEQAIRDGSRFKSEFRVLLPDGRQRYMIGKGSVTRHRDGKALRILGVNYDVTDRKEAEIRLRESEARLRMILDETAALAGIVDTDGNLQEVNRVALELGGIRHADVIGKPFWETPWWTHDDEEVSRLKQAIGRALEGQTVRYDARVRAADGSLRTIDFSLSPVLDADGEIALLVPAALDVTGRKEAENRLAEREAQLALFAEHAPAAIAMFDADLHYIACSKRYLADHGLSQDVPIMGRHYYEVLPDTPERWREVHRRVLSGETHSAEQDAIDRPDGTTDWLRWTMTPWYHGDGEIGGAMLFSEMLTEKVLADRALATSEARYRLLFESIDAGFCVVEIRFDRPDGRVDYRVVEANPAFYDRTGFDRNIAGAWLREAAPQLEEHWFDIYGSVARSGASMQFEQHSPHLDRWFDVFAFRIDRPQDNRVAILFHDITDRKRHEKRVDLLLKEVNHRSKNMLALIGVIAKRTTGEGHGEFLHNFSNRLAALAANQDILVHSDWEEVDLESLVRLQLAHFDDLLGKRILIEGDALPLLPETAEKFGMALHELATNAAKYGALSNKSGCVRIGWQTREVDGTAQFVLDWREEGGPTVSPPARTGFGSLVSGAMLEAGLGGTVEADYASDGLNWRLSCPLETVQRPADLAKDRPPADEPPESRRSGVLVLEDDPLLAMSLAETIAMAGFEVIGPACSADGALALIRTGSPEFAVLDVNLGRETSEGVALELQRRGVPFLCVSAYSAEQLPAGICGAPLLPKPVDEDRLMDHVRANVAAPQEHPA